MPLGTALLIIAAGYCFIQYPVFRKLTAVCATLFVVACLVLVLLIWQEEHRNTVRREQEKQAEIKPWNKMPEQEKKQECNAEGRVFVSPDICLPTGYTIEEPKDTCNPHHYSDLPKGSCSVN